MAASLLVYRRRHMETAGDIVAVKWLKPVFKYGFTLGVALMFNYITINMALQNSIGGPRAAVLVTVLLCAGAVIGFYGAEMLMQRSTHVFRSRPLGLVISCALLAGMVLGCELDPAGYEQRIPQREDIQYVRIFNSWRGLATDDPEAIDLYLSLHEAIPQNKAHNESSSVFRYMRLEYQLSDGSIFRRDYSVDSSREWIDSGSSELVLAQQFLALPSVKKCASAAVPSIKESSISSCWLMEKTPILASPEATDIVGYSENRISLSAEQAAELYNQCILPDLEDSRLGVNWLYQGPEYREYESNMVFCFTTASVNSPSPKVFNSEPEPVPNERSFNITMDAERTINWLGDNVGVTPVPMPDPADELYY